MKESVDVGYVVALPTFKLASIFHEQVDILHEEINADIIKNLLSSQDDGKILRNLQHFQSEVFHQLRTQPTQQLRIQKIQCHVLCTSS